MVVLVAGAHGRLGQRIVALLLHRGHRVRALVRADAQAEALRGIGAEAVVADLRGDVEWTAEGCDAAVFAAGARHRGELAAVDAGGAAKLAEAADRYELSRFILCSVIGADRPGRRDGTVGEFLAAKGHAEQRARAAARCRGPACASARSPRRRAAAGSPPSVARGQPAHAQPRRRGARRRRGPRARASRAPGGPGDRRRPRGRRRARRDRAAAAARRGAAGLAAGRLARRRAVGQPAATIRR